MIVDYLASYDLENTDVCVEAAKAVADAHRRHGIPATFFVVGRCLQLHGDELRGLLDDELFDLQSHTYSHALLCDSAVHGRGVTEDNTRFEIREGVRLVRDVLGRTCDGLRSPCGFTGGFQGAGTVLSTCRDIGLNYVSSDARGPGDSLPAPFKHPYTYADDGYPELWELPIHGWHDNVLKGFCPELAVLTYPPGEDWYLPPAPPKTPEEDAAHHLLWVDKAAEAGIPFISLAFHPWSLIRFDPGVRELDIILDGLAERGIDVLSATVMWRKLDSQNTAHAYR